MKPSKYLGIKEIIYQFPVYEKIVYGKTFYLVFFVEVLEISLKLFLVKPSFNCM